jgi:DNA-binding NarL/FixJ family response regulator
LATQSDLEVVGQAADARAAYPMVHETQPDVVVLDVALPGVTGIAVTRELKRLDPNRRVLILTMHTGEDFVAEALGSGATGYALKTQPSEEVLGAIRAVGRGETYLSPRVSRFVVEEHLRFRRGDAVEHGPLSGLTAREREVFELLVRGYGNDAISGQLCISRRTVETHRARLLKKLQLHSVADLVRFAAQHSLILAS